MAYSNLVLMFELNKTIFQVNTHDIKDFSRYTKIRLTKVDKEVKQIML